MPDRIVLSIQSEVVRGHVGNSAARFALQRIGIDVWAIPTVLLSNHPGHGPFRGETTRAATIAALIDGLDAHDWLKHCDGIITGYLGAAEQAGAAAYAVKKIKAANARAIYLCDPVFGDDDGAYAQPGVAEAMARELIPLADIVTPNRFELQSLTSQKISCARDAVLAARTLGVAEVIVTSVPFENEGIGTVAALPNAACAVSVPRISNVPHGSGDLLAALYLASRINGVGVDGALQSACSAIDRVLRASAGCDELRLIASQAELGNQTQLLDVTAL